MAQFGMSFRATGGNEESLLFPESQGVPPHLHGTQVRGKRRRCAHRSMMKRHGSSEERFSSPGKGLLHHPDRTGIQWAEGKQTASRARGSWLLPCYGS